MWDLQLGSVNLRLARSPTNQPLLTVGQDVREPAAAGQVDTITIPSFHHGPGRTIVVDDPNQYQRGIWTWTSDVGRLAPAGLSVDGTDFGTDKAVDSSQWYPGSFEHNGEAYFIIPGKVFKVSSTGVISTVGTLNSSYRFTGSVAYYLGKYYLAVDSTAGDAAGSVSFDGSTWGSFATPASDPKGSFFFAHRDHLWAIRNDKTNKKVDVLWTDSTSPATAANWLSLGRVETGGRASGVFVLGSRLLIFKEDGRILGFDENRRIIPIHEPQVPFKSNRFGHGAKQWGGQVLVPHENGLLAVDLENLRARDLSVRALNGVSLVPGIAASQSSVTEPTALYPMGEYLVMGTKVGPGQSLGGLYTLKNTPDGLFYNQIWSSMHSAIDAVGSQGDIWAIQAINNAGAIRLAILSGGSTASGIFTLHWPGLDGTVPPNIKTASFLDSSIYTGSGPQSLLTKQFLQVRGYGQKLTGGTSDTWTISATVDGTALGSLGTVTTNGPFSIPFPSTISAFGRSVSLTITFSTTGSARTGDDWPSIIMPIWIDFLHEPAAMDYVRLVIDKSSSGANIWNVYDGLRTLRQTVQTLTFNESAAAWTVFVESVERTKADFVTGTEGDREFVTVLLRRL